MWGGTMAHTVSRKIENTKIEKVLRKLTANLKGGKILLQGKG